MRKDSCRFSVGVISGRHLFRKEPNLTMANVFVKVEVLGCPPDCAVATTKVVQVEEA